MVLTVHENYYEESPDWNLHKLLPPELRIEKVNAFKITKPRLVGDIGLRAFFQLYKRAKRLIKTESFGFLYIPIPSFYCALLGRWLHTDTGIPYGIDYIDPWVHQFPGSDKIFSRHWVSTKIARFLEPIAIKKASLITGVAEGYYKDVITRNPQLLKRAVFGAMPYGGEEQDHASLSELDIQPYLFEKKKEKTQLVYAGAMLPKAYKPLETIFKSIKDHPQTFANVEFQFIGTGKTPDDAEGFNIKPLAQQYGLWQTIVYEYPKRIPYLDVLTHLQHSDGIFILGSTETHYTPSKSYQGILSGKPILAVLHKGSTAAEVLKKSGAAKVLSFNGDHDINSVYVKFPAMVKDFLFWKKSFNVSHINQEIFKKYSAASVTNDLAELLNTAIRKNNIRIT